jgi:hypothetical protein
MKWSALYAKNEGRRDRWAANLANIVMKIGRSVRSDLWDRVKLDAGYVEGLGERPVGLKKILAAVRKIATGHGAHSLYLDLTRLFETKMVDGGWVTFFREFRNNRGKIKNRVEPPEEILEAIYDTIFIMGVLDQPKLEKQVSEVLALTKWPAADELMRKWTVTLETIQGIKRGSNPEGKVIANAARSAATSSRPRGSAPSPKPLKDAAVRQITCFGCGKEGHVVSECTSEPVNCSTCGDQHHTSMHERVMLIAKRNKRKAVPHPKSPAARGRSANPAHKSAKTTAYSMDSNSGDSDDDLQLADLTRLYGLQARSYESDVRDYADLPALLTRQEVESDEDEEINAHAAMVANVARAPMRMSERDEVHALSSSMSRMRMTSSRNSVFDPPSEDDEDIVLQAHSSVHFEIDLDPPPDVEAFLSLPTDVALCCA